MVEPRPADVFYRAVPGGHFPLDDGTDSPIGNLHLGVFDSANARPHPDPAGVEPRDVSREGHTARTWVLVDDNDSRTASSTPPSASAPPSCGATTTGPSSTATTARSSTRGATRYPVAKGGDKPQLPAGYTGE